MNGLYCLHDARIRATSTDVAAHPFSNFVRCEFYAVAPDFIKHGNGGADLARSAIAALEAVLFDKCRLQRMQLFAIAETFDCSDFVSVMNDCESEAAIDPTSVHEHRASTTLSMIATFLGT